MRLFWKEQLPLLLFLVPQIFLVPLLYWLAGSREPDIALYALLLSVTFLLLYLGYHYFSRREVYRKLTKPPERLEELMEPSGETPLALAFDFRMESGYRLFQEELYRYRSQMETNTAFTNRWVHQMKTPLSVIQLTLENEKEALPEHVIESIQEELDRLRRGLEMALYTSRLERFESDFRVDRVSLREVVNRTVAAHRRLFIRKGVYPVIEIDEDVHVFSDEKWLEFILGQIAINAVNYSAGKGNKVEFTATRLAKKIMLEITDYGVGIRKEDIRRVFDPYFTGEQGRQYRESTGMGLYLVREVCRRLDHKVELESSRGDGTTVRMIFTADRKL
ncbi:MULTISPECIES: sensor histidine kinase [Paenibacillus]|uniref:sensor histidine kinase n=1 Tax=Paenibacillus TaxID=44249 RepID=UPI002FE233A0